MHDDEFMFLHVHGIALVFVKRKKMHVFFVHAHYLSKKLEIETPFFSVYVSLDASNNNMRIIGLLKDLYAHNHPG